VTDAQCLVNADTGELQGQYKNRDSPTNVTAPDDGFSIPLPFAQLPENLY
jgi:hypothetical protein